MYSLTRQETAEKLGVSTRSVDRYVKSGKLRSKKIGKIIYINDEDVQNIAGGSSSPKAQVIIPEQKVKTETFHEKSTHIETKEKSRDSGALERVYLDLRNEIKIKDKAIQDLSLKLGQAQEIAKNSVSLIEFKKSQFLLEESKGHIAGENSDLKKESQELQEKLKYEKSTNYILIAFCIVMTIGFGLLWFLKI